jgi:hypothetical protein
MIHVELPFAVLEELAKFEQRRSFEEKFGDDASSTEHIHGFGHSTILSTFDILTCASQLGLLGADIWVLTCRVKPFRCNITSSASGGVKVEGEIGRVVEREVSWLVRSEVGDIHPIPRGDKDVFAFNISVRDLAVASIAKSCKDLERDPLLLNR